MPDRPTRERRGPGIASARRLLLGDNPPVAVTGELDRISAELTPGGHRH